MLEKRNPRPAHIITYSGEHDSQAFFLLRPGKPEKSGCFSAADKKSNCIFSRKILFYMLLWYVQEALPASDELPQMHVNEVDQWVKKREKAVI